MSEHSTHEFRRRVEVRRYTTSATVGVFRCVCGDLFARPLTEDEDAESTALAVLLRRD